MRIHDIQGAAHRSPLEGTAVSSVPGVVTDLGSTGIYMEDPLPDSNPATSEGIFVYTGAAPTVTVGQYFLVSGTVNEFRPGSTSGVNNLTTPPRSPRRRSPLAARHPRPCRRRR